MGLLLEKQRFSFYLLRGPGAQERKSEQYGLLYFLLVRSFPQAMGADRFCIFKLFVIVIMNYCKLCFILVYLRKVMFQNAHILQTYSHTHTQRKKCFS